MSEQKTQSQQGVLNTAKETNARIDTAVASSLSRFHVARGVTRMLVLTGLTFAVFAVISPNVFLNPLNLQNIAIASPEIGLLALAIMLAMLTGGIDLSVVAIANLTAITISTLYTSIATRDEALANQLGLVIVLVGFLVGMLGGFINGLLVSKVGITPILATLGTMQIYNGIAIAWTGGSTLYGAPEVLNGVGKGTVAGIPLLFIIFAAAAALLAVVVNKTALGTTITLQGANPEAAKFSGMRTGRTLMSTYVMTGALAALAGILIVSRNPTASADYGSSYILLVIVIAVLGGTNPNGGFGTVLGVVLATLTLQIVSSGFNIIRLTSYDYAIAQGVILIGIMVLDQVSTKRTLRPLRKPKTDAAAKTQD